MLTFHVLNVGHGDSTVVEYHSPDGPKFAVIDSNCTGPGDPPALGKLKQLGAERLSFVALSHPHADHYKGLSAILEHYAGRIDSYFSFPLHRHTPGRVHKLAEIYQKLLESSDSPTIRGRALEFVKILTVFNENQDEWQEPTGYKSPIAPTGFNGVEVSILLPLPKEKGAFFTAIMNGSMDILTERELENRISLAFHFKYSGQEVIIGGDGTYMNWLDHKKQMDRAKSSLRARTVRLPHHGAKEDCKDPVIDHLFDDAGPPRYACISANGHTHPSPDTYAALEKRGILPYCTNLALQCGAKLRESIETPELSPVLVRLINSLAEQPTESIVQPCQGDITIHISPNGELSVSPQYNHPCPYRGGYGFLDLLAKPGDTIH